MLLFDEEFCLNAVLLLLLLAAEDSPVEDLVYNSFGSLPVCLLDDLESSLSLESLLATKLGFMEVVGLEELMFAI